MTCSPARLEANRRNAARSTGPKTVEGKERSRANGLKHGLTGAGVVVPDEDVEAIEERFAAFEAELRPTGEVGRFLARRAAMLSVRLDRCARHEAAMTSKRVRDAEADGDEARRGEVEAMGARLASEPAVVVRRLKMTPEGVDWLIRQWHALKGDLLRPDKVFWGRDKLGRVANLMGRVFDAYPFEAIDAVGKAIWGDTSGLAPDQGADLDPPARSAWAREQVGRAIDAEVAALEDLRPTLDELAIALDRAEAGRRALFDPSKEATLARKYEAAAERGLFRTLRELRELPAEGPARAEAEAPAPEAALASSSPADPAPTPASISRSRRPRPDRPRPAVAATPFAPIAPIAADGSPEPPRLARC